LLFVPIGKNKKRQRNGEQALPTPHITKETSQKEGIVVPLGLPELIFTRIYGGPKEGD